MPEQAYSLEIVINDKKSDVYLVRGDAIVDGIRIPFTVYRLRTIGDFDELVGNFLDRLALRSKSGILSKYKNGESIRRRIKDAARGWFIDNDHWRT